MTLVYDVRQDDHMKKALSRHPKQWRSLEQGKKRTKISEGRISNMFFYAYDGEQMFELDEGARRSSWIRFGDQSRYALGRLARVEHTAFRSLRFGKIPVVVKIWIGVQ